MVQNGGIQQGRDRFNIIKVQVVSNAVTDCIRNYWAQCLQTGAAV